MITQPRARVSTKSVMDENASLREEINRLEKRNRLLNAQMSIKQAVISRVTAERDMALRRNEQLEVGLSAGEDEA